MSAFKWPAKEPYERGIIAKRLQYRKWFFVKKFLSPKANYCGGLSSGLFPRLSSEDSELKASVTAIKAFAVMYCASHDGFFERRERPPLLQVGILARIPPLHALQERPWTVSGQATGKVMD